MSDNGNKTLFGYPIRDWVILASFIGSILAGGLYVGGTPGQTKSAIDTQTQLLSEELKAIRAAITLNSQLAQRNALRIDAIEHTNEGLGVRLDSIHETLMDGLDNLDGYFRGRLDQLRPSPSGG